jgi:hypothetical protein
MRLPVVMSRDEVKAVLDVGIWELSGTWHLMASLLYGSSAAAGVCRVRAAHPSARRYGAE